MSAEPQSPYHAAATEAPSFFGGTSLTLRRPSRFVPRVAIFSGFCLCILTMVGLVGTRSNGVLDAFLPMLAGVPLFLCGVVGLNLGRRRDAMRLAFALTLMSFFAAGTIALRHIPGILEEGPSIYSFAASSLGATTLICLLFVLVYLRDAWIVRQKDSSR